MQNYITIVCTEKEEGLTTIFNKMEMLKVCGRHVHDDEICYYHQGYNKETLITIDNNPDKDKKVINFGKYIFLPLEFCELVNKQPCWVLAACFNIPKYGNEINDYTGKLDQVFKKLGESSYYYEQVQHYRSPKVLFI